jgi:hypothetical protein
MEMLLYYIIYIYIEARGSVVEVLCYKPEGRGFESR